MAFIGKRVVVKIGTNVLTDEGNKLDRKHVETLTDELAYLHRRGAEVIVVSSGAVSVGRGVLDMVGGVDSITQRQVFSAVGQSTLMHVYQTRFEVHDIVCAQVLVTQEDFGTNADEVHVIDRKSHFQNMNNCIEALLEQGVIPILNENDVVALDELMFTDNDELAGLVSLMLKADTLIILSSIPGLLRDYEKGESTMIHDVYPSHSKSSIMKFISSEKSSGGRGGMQSKIETAFNMRDAGIDTYIVDGKDDHIIGKVMSGEKVGTKFHAEAAGPEDVLTFFE